MLDVSSVVAHGPRGDFVRQPNAVEHVAAVQLHALHVTVVILGFDLIHQLPHSSSVVIIVIIIIMVITTTIIIIINGKVDELQRH